MGGLEFGLLVMQTLPGLIKAGKDVNDLLRYATQTLQTCKQEKRNPIKAEWDQLNTTIAGLRERLHSDTK